MNEKKLSQFTSYIKPPLDKEEKNGTLQELKPKLLNEEAMPRILASVDGLLCSAMGVLMKGELVTGAARDVVMLTPLSESSRGRLGSLFVTNYKVSFVPLDESNTDECGQRNFLLGAFDVPLTVVGAVWLTDGGHSRRRKLLPYGEVSAKVKGLQVVCKNMKVLTFSFANSPIDSGRKIALAIMHHAFPKRHDLLFAFEYKEPYFPTLPSDMNMFQRTIDWKRELERCECPHWRITCINGTSDAFMLTAGETLIVPSSVLDYNLMESARYFRSGRVPIWVWGRPEGAALLRSGELLQTEQSSMVESVLLEQVRGCHPKLTPPHVIYLCGNTFTNSGGPGVLPSLAALQTSFKKLTELCTPSTLEAFWTQDSQYYSILDSSRWLRHVANCIGFAEDAARRLSNNVTVVLQEGDGVDYCAVVSCLTQLLVDPYFRTISGFQSLVQKEWLALGHPFCDRFGLPRPGNPKDMTPKESNVKSESAQAAPVFLLFLDCCWQLTQQFPAHFQFTETYLATLWDCAHNHIFDTFIFNCVRDRDLALSKKFVGRPVWDWGEQFSDQDKALFYNPLYTPATVPASSPAPGHGGSRVAPLARLEACSSVAGMELWALCYERWLAPLAACGAGSVHYHLHNYALRAQMYQLNTKLSSLSLLSRRRSSTPEPPAPPGPPGRRPHGVSRFFPFSVSRGDVVAPTLDSMQLSLIDASQLVESQSLLNAPD